MSVPICNLFTFHEPIAVKYSVTTSIEYSSLTLACADLLEPRRSELGLLKFTFMLKISYAGYLGLSLAISAQFSLKMCIATQNREFFTKTHYFGGLSC